MRRDHHAGYDSQLDFVMERKLAAILAVDVVGYSALMEADEAGTFDRLRAGRKELFEPEIARHHGRVFKLMGDGILAEFGSVVDAVECAVALQRGLAERNASISKDRRFEVRIGINLGEVIVEGDDRYGEGVNVAARLQQLAEPGGICVSEKVSREVEKKLAFGFEPMGEQKVKNIAEPISCFRIALQIPVSAPDQSSQKPPKLPDKPAIAVLPFQNLSGDPEQEYFSDGLTEDIITELSRFKSLFVAARNSAFHYKGKSPNVQSVGRELGVRYVVEGSVRKSGNRVRVTAQLIDTATGGHLWAERYDRDLADIFAVQDEVVHTIAGVVPGQINRVAVEEIKRKPPANLTAYDRVLRGRWALSRLNEGLAKAHDWFEGAIAADPESGLAHACLANTFSLGVLALGLSPDAALARAREHAERATVLDPENAQVNAYAATAYTLCGDSRRAVSHAERAVALNPNDARTLYALAQALTYAGEQQRALEWFARSEKLEPYAPDDDRLDWLCDCHYLLGSYEKVVEIHRSYQEVYPFLFLVLAAACAQLGQTEAAKDALTKYERTRPREHDAATMIKYHVRMCAKLEDRDRWLEGYRKIGFDV
jgi:TolB-like protein/class 3 adenylate cyclase/tetratricopeptide (TPR) repeat protein